MPTDPGCSCISRALLAGAEAFQAVVGDFAVCFLFKLTAGDGKPLRWLWQHSEPWLPFSQGLGAASTAGWLGEAAAGEARMTQTFKKLAAAVVQVPTCTLLSVFK